MPKIYSKYNQQFFRLLKYIEKTHLWNETVNIWIAHVCFISIPYFLLMKSRFESNMEPNSFLKKVCQSSPCLITGELFYYLLQPPDLLGISN